MKVSCQRTRNNCAFVLAAAPLIIPRNWKWPSYLSTNESDEWKVKLQSIYTCNIQSLKKKLLNLQIIK